MSGRNRKRDESASNPQPDLDRDGRGDLAGRPHAEALTGMDERDMTGDELRVPVAEERLTVGKRRAELGEVQVRKTVVEELQTIPVELQREEVRVERRDVADRPARAGDDLFQGGTIRVPVRGEEAQVAKEAVVTGEVVIEKERTTERQQVTDTIRKERVEVDENYERARAGFQEHFGRRQAAAPAAGQQRARSFEEAEPNYRVGYTAAGDPRHAGRQFEEVEPELRGAHAGSDGDSWEQLRDEIREGWSHARNG